VFSPAPVNSSEHNPVFLGENLPHDLDEFGIGEVEQPAISRDPLISMEQARYLPAAIDALEAVFIPTVLRVLGLATM
jgi:hypothetical protein